MQQKKTIYSILSVMVAMIVLSVSLVLAIGPRVSAAHFEDNIYVIDNVDDFDIDDNGVLTNLKSQVFSDADMYYGSGYWHFNNRPTFSEVHIIIPDSVKHIECGDSFKQFSGYLTSVTLPDGLETIGQRAFSDCYNLKSINIPDSVTTIGQSAFAQCRRLKNVFIPASVETIGPLAFNFCDNTVYCETVTIPDGWGDGWRYEPLEYLDVDPGYYVPSYNCPRTRWNCVTDGEFIYQLMDDNTYGVVAYLGDEQAIVLPKSFNDVAVTTIPEGAFAGCENLTAVTIPSSITTIGSGAFARTNLETVVIPDNVITMGEAVFTGCENLTTIYCEVANKPAGWERYWDWTWDWFNCYESEWGEGEMPQCDENGWADTDNISVEWGYVTKYQVTFNANNGTAVDTLTVNKRNTVTAPETPVKEGYEFKGWYADEALTNEYDFDAAVTDDVNLYAKWEAVQAQPEQPESETPTEENTEVNNQNNAGLIWGIAGTSAGVLIVAGIAVGIVITKRRRK